ncbi:Mu-like prophage major head subunit gpT family protein [Phaeobacter inhibens]|uniref:Mu-like prophage major head subunit gpT family protein n=1 Tax=Phaeobacter inhibens TaxID=221822 RepID=UPI0021A28403|nr:Mu-like prophage major head subunit gpT family protein [Phaeobacter inhibens]UWR43656.1 Mu-like prophage major head subunit gpT family protein [Phaeobacter inhibens]
MAAITPAVLSALWTGAKKNFNDGYEAMANQSFYKDVCTIVNSNDDRETYDWLGDAPEMREWIGDRVVKDIKSHGYQIINQEFETTIGVKAKDIKNDKLGTYGPRFRRLGEAAARKPDQMVRDLIINGASQTCYDGQYFFDTDHPVYAGHDGTGAVTTISNMTDGAGSPWYMLDLNSVLRPFIFQEREKVGLIGKEDPKTSDHVFMRNQYLYGADAYWAAGYGFWQMAHMSKAELNGDNFDAAFEAMMGVTGDGGRELGLMPSHIMVGRSNRSKANKVVKMMLGDGGASNPNYNEVKVLVNPWLP